MLLALDVHYDDEVDQARAAGVVFDAWEAQAALETVTRMHRGIAQYVPGEFLRRELPCILPLVQWALQRHDIRVIIVDGFVDLEAGRAGLGRHLAAELPPRRRRRRRLQDPLQGRARDTDPPRRIGSTAVDHVDR